MSTNSKKDHKDVIPLIDLLSFLPRKDSAPVIQWTKDVMDEEGVALISFAGYWAPKKLGGKGHRWDYFIHRLVNAEADQILKEITSELSKQAAELPELKGQFAGLRKYRKG